MLFSFLLLRRPMRWGGKTCLPTSLSDWSAPVRDLASLTRLLPGVVHRWGGRPPEHVATGKGPRRRRGAACYMAPVRAVLAVLYDKVPPLIVTWLITLNTHLEICANNWIKHESVLNVDTQGGTIMQKSCRHNRAQLWINIWSIVLQKYNLESPWLKSPYPIPSRAQWIIILLI